MSNNFSENTTDLFVWMNKCENCGEELHEYKQGARHHIMGRGGKNTSSPLNFCKLCNSCHDMAHGLGDERKEELQGKLLFITMSYLIFETNYNYNRKDESFFDEFRYLYNSNKF